MSDELNEGRPFYRQFYPCGCCRKKIEIQNAFSHWLDQHSKDLIVYRYDKPNHCRLCGTQLASLVTGNDGWRKRFAHFRQEHGIEIIDSQMVASTIQTEPPQTLIGKCELCNENEIGYIWYDELGAFYRVVCLDCSQNKLELRDDQCYIGKVDGESGGNGNG